MTHLSRNNATSAVCGTFPAYPWPVLGSFGCTGTAAAMRLGFSLCTTRS